MKHLKYSVLIQWSEEDQLYIASMPEWGEGAKTHGRTYQEAAEMAEEALEVLLQGEDNPPAPHLFSFPAEIESETETPAGTEA